MHLCITGFLSNDADDDLVKFDLEIDEAFNEQIVKYLGHRSINAMAEGEWPLTSEQVNGLSSIIGQTLPKDLNMFIGLEA
jgi:hypothetical protein